MALSPHSSVNVLLSSACGMPIRGDDERALRARPECPVAQETLSIQFGNSTWLRMVQDTGSARDGRFLERERFSPLAQPATVRKMPQMILSDYQAGRSPRRLHRRRVLNQDQP